MSTNNNSVSTVSASLPFSKPELLVQEFASRGLVVLDPESLGIPLDVHERIYVKEKAAYLAKQPVSLTSIPEVLEVLQAPGLITACNQLVGENWAIVPFTHNATFASGAMEQHWHKDDSSPYGGRKQRHHQTVQIEMLYYPQAVREDMGPTATIPYSQYWTLNHEENQDSFVGADMLDFNYVLSGMEKEPVSGPDSKYDIDDIVNRRTTHDIRMQEAVTNTGWPLVQSFEAAPLRAGTVVLYSHNMYHRGNHRSDDWQTWNDNPRFMWRFWIYRTTETVSLSSAPPAEVSWNKLGVDPLTKIDLSDSSDDVTVVWRYQNHWMKTGRTPPPRTEATNLSSEERANEADRLFVQLHVKHEEAEPDRIGAAYKLASIGDTTLAVQLLGKALYNERESVRRAATYGLVAVGQDATNTFLKATTSPVKWVRKAGVYGLGDVGHLNDEVLQVVATRLQDDPSVYVRAVAAGTLGCLGRRAIATGIGDTLVPACLDALVQCLSREENRLSMDIAQGRIMQFVRPNDECDVCEGGSKVTDFERFEKVRSAVRENALWSLVILCSHECHIIGPALEQTIHALKEVVSDDKNIISVGFAMDALNRLANQRPKYGVNFPSVKDLQADLPAILGESPLHCWESLVRGGLSAGTVFIINPSD